MYKFPGAPKGKRRFIKAVRKKTMTPQTDTDGPCLLDYVVLNYEKKDNTLIKIFGYLSAKDLKSCKLVSMTMTMNLCNSQVF